MKTNTHTRRPVAGPGAITARGLSHSYASTQDRSPTAEAHVLRNIDLDIQPGTFVSVLGPSGCGKTTLLRIIGGLVTPSVGTVSIDGVPVTGPPWAAATVFQDHNLMPWRRAVQNVEFALEPLGIPRAKRTERALSALRLVGLEQHTHRYPWQLSGGMQQRVGIARALVVEPQILLMDEPFGALDAQTRETMQGELLQIWEQHRRTVVFVTHSIEEAVYLSDRVLVLRAHPGRLCADVTIDVPRPRGNSDEFRTSPAMIEHRRRLAALLRAAH